MLDPDHRETIERLDVARNTEKREALTGATTAELEAELRRRHEAVVSAATAALDQCSVEQAREAIKACRHPLTLSVHR